MSAQRPLLLLAEDDVDVRELAELVLHAEGFDVVAVGDGEAAVAAAARCAPDVVVLDVSMPRLDGLGALRRLRGAAATSSVPVMLLTARVTEQDRALGRAAGADDQLDKPFAPRELARHARALLGG